MRRLGGGLLPPRYARGRNDGFRVAARRVGAGASYGFRPSSSSPAATSEASPSSRCAAPSLRYGRFAVTAPLRCGGVVSMIFDERSRPAGPARSTKIMETKSLSRAQGSRLARASARPGKRAWP